MGSYAQCDDYITFTGLVDKTIGYPHTKDDPREYLSIPESFSVNFLAFDYNDRILALSSSLHPIYLN